MTQLARGRAGERALAHRRRGGAILRNRFVIETTASPVRAARTLGAAKLAHHADVAREGTHPYASSSFPSLQRASFAQHQLWVTRYHEGELQAAGDYPNQGEVGDGIADYASPAENVRGKDVVVWYTVGLTHHPKPEEYPVMSTELLGFSLRPSGFFDQNPALDVPIQN